MRPKDRNDNCIAHSNNARRLVIMLLVLALLLSGCALKPSYDIDSADDEVQEFSEWKYNSEDYVTAREKDEIVTAHADASGVIKSVEDAVTLKGIADLASEGVNKDAVRDKTNLTEITNRNGDEDFEVKDGYVYFRNLGRDISYEGTAEARLPVNVRVRYYLDGKEMKAGKIAGKKGHVKVEYTLNNSEQCDIEAGGVCRRVYVPFAAVTVVMLEDDSYTGLKTHDCKLSTVSSENVIMALTMPGMKSNLETMNIDALDSDIPESFSFEMDTDSFKLGFSTTIVTSRLLEESIDLGELDDLKDSLSDLKSAGKKLVDGSDKIEEGLNDFGGYLTQYVGGVDKIDKGISGLAKGIRSLDKSKSAVYSGAKGMADALGAYKEAYDGIQPLLDEMIEEDPQNEELQELMQWYEALSGQNTLLAEESVEFADGVRTFNKGLSSVKDGAEKLRKGSGKLASQGSKLSGGYDSLRSGYSKYSKGVRKFYKDGLAELKKKGTQKINDIENFIRTIEQADKEYKTYSGIEKDQESRVTFIIETEAVD